MELAAAESPAALPLKVSSPQMPHISSCPELDTPAQSATTPQGEIRFLADFS
jgi:hypothetical protein